MNCKVYQEKFDNYIEGRLDDDLRRDFDDHLEKCSECREQLGIIKLLNLVISEEKKIESNPFLSSKIMARLEVYQSVRSESVSEILSKRVLRPVLVAAAVILAVILGISVGNMSSTVYLSQQIPDELIYINDAEIESLDLFITE